MNPRDVSTLDALAKFAAGFAAQLTGNEIILLSGPMGAGKTEFVKQLVAALSGTAPDGHKSTHTASPTYAFHHEYSIRSGAFAGKVPSVDHWDLYRLKNSADLESIGFWDSVSQSRGVICVEWPERVPAEDWPKTRRLLHLDFKLNEVEGAMARMIHQVG